MKYKEIYEKNNFINNDNIFLGYHEGFTKQKDNFIFGVKIFYNDFNSYKIKWNKEYSIIVAMILESEFEHKDKGWEDAEKIFFNDKFYYELNENIINEILSKDNELIVFGTVEYINIASQIIWYLKINNYNTLEEELKRQNIYY